MKKTVLKEAFVCSLPVLMGYLSMGAAFGILLTANTGLRPWWAFFMGVTILSGSLQFASVDILCSTLSFAEIAVLSLFINIRYSMYGLSLIQRFREAGWRRWYLIFALTDETYALIVKRLPASGRGDSDGFMLALSLMNHLYWIGGCVLGSVAGTLIPFNPKGIDFSMTALFLVILTDQCRDRHNRPPALIGIAATILSRIFFGPGNMLIPAMILILISILVFRRQLECPEKEKVSS